MEKPGQDYSQVDELERSVLVKIYHIVLVGTLSTLGAAYGHIFEKRGNSLSEKSSHMISGSKIERDLPGFL